MPESAITVSDRDLKKFYDGHQDDFERERLYTIEYVTRSKLPTAVDTADVFEDVMNKKATFETADDDSLFLIRNYSSRVYNSVTFRRDELPDEVSDDIFDDLTPGRVVGPIAYDNMMHLVKITSVEPSDEMSVKASHILIRATEGNDEEMSSALTEARSLRRRILAGEDFAALASEFSDDRQSALRGGSLGWFGPGAMVESFEEAAFATRIGSVTRPVKSRFGYHIIKVEGKTSQAVKIADYALPIRTLISSLTKIEDDLEDLAEFSKDDGFRAEAERREYTVQTVQIEEDQESIPQLGNSRKLIDFLAESKVGSISEIIELNDQYLVATVTKIERAGVRPFDDVKSELEPRVKIEKRKAYQNERLAKARAESGTLADIAAAVSGAVQTANDVAINNPLIPGLGREPSLLGTALGLGSGQVSQVVDGGASSFVLKETAQSTLAVMTDTEKESIRAQLTQQRQSALRVQWIQDVREQAKIVDNRRRLTQF